MLVGFVIGGKSVRNRRVNSGTILFGLVRLVDIRREAAREMVHHSTTTKQNIKNRTTINIRLLAIMLILVFVGAIVIITLAPGRLCPRDVSVGQLYEHPSVYVGQKVSVVGYLVKHAAPHFGDTYTLCEGDPRNVYFAVNPCIAVAGAPSTIDTHLSFIYDGIDYAVAPSPCSFAVPCCVVLSGVFVDRGPATDAARYVLEVSSAAWFAE